MLTNLQAKNIILEKISDLTQRALKVAVPMGILGAAAFVCYCSWKKARQQVPQKLNWININRSY